MEITLESVLRKCDEVVCRSFAGETVLVPIRKTAAAEDDHFLYALHSGVAGRIYELCDGERRLDQVAIEIEAAYEVEMDRLREDLLLFAAKMVKIGALEPVD